MFADMKSMVTKAWREGYALLAVSVGTAHGIYAPGVKPILDFDRLAQLQRVSSVPLALHGGSGTPFDQLQRCAEFGIAKINVGAAVFEAGKAALLHTLCHDSTIELAEALSSPIYTHPALSTKPD